ncbi:myb-like protein X isoform X1 [Cynara cardunculus var. scolymus]|nr:myb-like protein X isoform X1 [Cynara cardunculus var. scolymus]
MSRCFPFPPPGYEKKPTTDDADLLKKEKRKEKKHKKDKKDREKREGKEKKDRSDGKHKEKKDKKDKHRDKKKDKENGKDKEKGRSNYSDEKRVDGQFEGPNAEMLHQKNEHNKQKDGSSGHKKSSVQFQNGEPRELLLRKEESCKENCNSLDDKKSSVKLWGQNEELLVRNRIQAEDINNSKFVQELGRRIRDEEKRTGSLQFPVESRKISVDRGEIPKTDGPRITNEVTFGRLVMVQNIIDGTMPPLDKWADKKVEDKEKMREKENDDKRGDKRKNKDRDKQRQGKDKDKDKDRTKEEKMKKASKLTKTERDKNKDMKNSGTIGSLKDLSTHSPNIGLQRAGSELKKRKDVETNGFSHENEPRPNKMARPTSSILTENGRKQDFLQNPGLSLAGKQGTTMGSFKVDSKERRVNGVIPSQPMTITSKKPPITTANHILCKPTTIKSPPVSIDHVATKQSPIPTTKPPSSVPNHIPTQPFSDPLTKTSSTVANQNLAHSLPISSTKPSPVVAVANKIAAQPLPNSKKKPPAEASIRPPHPDIKYLKQILTVPKMEQWSGLDDQEWLYSSSKGDPHFKKTTKDDALQDNKELEVWSEAKHLESVDICALPYVIPY